MLAVGTLLLVAAGWLTTRTLRFLEHSRTARGTVIELKAIRQTSRNQGGSYAWAPVFTFITAKGQLYTAQSSTSSNPPSFHVGEQIIVYYDPAQPNDARVGTFFGIWGAEVVLAIVGLGMIGMSLAFALYLRRLARGAISGAAG